MYFGFIRKTFIRYFFFEIFLCAESYKLPFLSKRDIEAMDISFIKRENFSDKREKSLEIKAFVIS